MARKTRRISSLSRMVGPTDSATARPWTVRNVRAYGSVAQGAVWRLSCTTTGQRCLCQRCLESSGRRIAPDEFFGDLQVTGWSATVLDRARSEFYVLFA